jgi:hypothetical protein
VSTQPRSPREHYQAALRLVAATAESPENAAMLALVHSVLTLSPRRARRVGRQARRAGNSGLPPHLQWGGDA